eukprot:1335669-Ditylum_brightwellii.AAC.1
MTIIVGVVPPLEPLPVPPVDPVPTTVPVPILLVPESVVPLEVVLTTGLVPEVNADVPAVEGCEAAGG